MAMDDEREKIGEALYMKVVKIAGNDVAGKITGMMLDSLEDSELRKVMDDEPFLKEKVAQAMGVLKSDNSEQPKPKEKPENGNGSKKADAKIKELQNELNEAEKWAEEMQGQWDTKEAKWAKDKEALMKRLTAAEARAEAAAKTPTNGSGADKVEVLTAKVSAVEGRLQASESEKADAKKELAAVEERCKQAAQKAKASDEEVSKLKAELAAKDARLKDEEAASSKLKSAVAAKEEEVQSLANAAAKAAKPETLINGKDHDKAELDALKEERDKARAEARRDRQELENANKEIKGYKAQLKGSTNSKAPAKDAVTLEKRLPEAACENQAPSKDAVTLEKRPPEAEPDFTPVPKGGKTKQGAGTDSSKKAKPSVEAKPAAPAPTVITEPPEQPEEDEEAEEEEEAPAPEDKRRPSPSASKAAPDAKNKAHPTASGKSSKKKSASASDVMPATPSKKQKSSIQLTGTHVVAGTLVVVVMIQLGLFVYEGWFGDPDQTWVQ